MKLSQVDIFSKITHEGNEHSKSQLRQESLSAS